MAETAQGPFSAGLTFGTRSQHPLSLMTSGRPQVQVLQDGGINMLDNGVIQVGGTAGLRTQDLGLYSQLGGRWVRLVTTNAPIAFFTDGGTGKTPQLTVNERGQVVISGSLFVNGPLDYFRGPDGLWRTCRTAAATTPGSYSTGGPSDARLKTAVRRCAHALASVLRLTGLRYRWDETGLEHLTRDAVDGVSAGPDATDEEDRCARAAAWAGPSRHRRRRHRAHGPGRRAGRAGGRPRRSRRLQAHQVRAAHGAPGRGREGAAGDHHRLAGRVDALATGKER